MNGDKKRIIFTIIFIVSFIFIIRLFQLQILSDKYKKLAENNIIQQNTIFPSRGVIYDRNNKIIVSNQPIYDIVVIPKEVELIDTLSFLQLFNMSKHVLDDKLNDAKNYSFIKPSIFYKGINNNEFLSIQEEIDQYPGFYVIAKSMRDYPNKILSHVMGYVGEISFKTLNNDSLGNYLSGDDVGISGIEKKFENELKGEKGYEYKIHNVKGESIGSYKNKSNDIIVQRGHNLISTIDLDLQLYIEKLLLNKIGSVVAIEPISGEILAIASSPSYDPNLLTGRFYSKNYITLEKDSLKPLFNRSLSAMYPPGSMFKLVHSLIALEEKLINSKNEFFINNTIIGDLAPSGFYDLKKAIVLSSNNFFYRLFRKIINQKINENTYLDSGLGLNIWNNYVSQFGLGTNLNTDLYSVLEGFVPDENYYDNLYGKNRWKFSNIYSLSIGQGELLVTPIQMANVAAIIANKGKYISPHIIKSIEIKNNNYVDIKKEYINTSIDPKHYKYIIDAMEEVVNNGSARRAFISNIIICGKTSTVENPHGFDHSGFIGFAPKENPKIAIATYIENAGWGGRAAASISSLAIEYYINRKISRKWLEEYVLKGEFIDDEKK